MGLYLRQDEQRSKVQQQVEADLKARLQKAANAQKDESEPTMLENQHQTRWAGMIIMILIALFFVGLIVFAIRIS